MMESSAASRPLSQQRPTQAYYVPRKLLEGGRGVLQGNEAGKEGEDTRKNSTHLTAGKRSLSPKEKNERKENLRPKKNGQKTPKSRNEPRPLMSEILTKPEYLKDKRNQKTRDIAAPVVEKLKDLTTSVPRIISAKNCPVSLPSYAFSPRRETDICLCSRPISHIACRCCGFETTGRIFRDTHCKFHPTSHSHLFSDDLHTCPNAACRSIQIFELTALTHSC